VIRFRRPIAATEAWDKTIGGIDTQKIMFAFHLTENDYSYHGPNRGDPIINWDLNKVSSFPFTTTYSLSLFLLSYELIGHCC
jgi:hypothetical protein